MSHVKPLESTLIADVSCDLPVFHGATPSHLKTPLVLPMDGLCRAQEGACASAQEGACASAQQPNLAGSLNMDFVW
jgi:hypothetical protein